MNLPPTLIGLVLAAASAMAAAQQMIADVAGQPAEPAQIQLDPEVAAARISKALRETKGLPADAVSVSTHAGTIVLSGELDNEAQRAGVLQVAEAAAGGLRVTNSLQVRPMDKRSPQEQLAAQQMAQQVRDVEAALTANASTANLGIVVSSAEPGTILLTGLVPTSEIRTLATRIALRVKGVTRIESRLQTPEH